MDYECATVTFFSAHPFLEIDLQVPLFITAEEFMEALQRMFDLHTEGEDASSHCLRSEYPIGLLQRSRTLAEAGIHEGSRIIW